MTDPITTAVTDTAEVGTSIFSGLSTYIIIATVFLVIGLAGGWYIKTKFYDASETAQLKDDLAKQTKLASQYQDQSTNFQKLNDALLTANQANQNEAHKIPDPMCGNKPIPAARVRVLRAAAAPTVAK